MKEPEAAEHEPAQGDLVRLPDGRLGRFVWNCGSFVVCTKGDPDAGNQTVFDLVALPWSALEHV